MGTVIDNFSGEYRWLSNFWASPAVYRGHIYPTAEHAYQAAKALLAGYAEVAEQIQQAETPGQAKRLGATVEQEPVNWRDGRGQQIMADLVASKFRHDLRVQLLQTGDALLVEGNTWHDNFWGKCFCAGCYHRPSTNYLGVILMSVRASLG